MSGDNAGGGGKKKRAVHGKQRKGFTGRLSKGAGTHLASWLQEVDNVTVEEATTWLEQPEDGRTREAVEKLREQHGRAAGHAA